MKFFHILFLFYIPWSLAGQDYQWPTDAGKLLSSTFAESRENRFHAGMDVKTQGQVGFKVFAVRSGFISRVQVSPFGYGRVLYQTLDTGEIAVYGHLLKFLPSIQEAVERKQEAHNRYSVTLTPNKDQFPVKQGDLIGYTGQSGIGHPHLHFELRDASSRPINPHGRGFVVQDQLAPVIQSVSVTPLAASARVNADLRPFIIQPRRLGAARYQIDKPIQVAGMIAFGLEAFDQMENSPNKFGAYSNRLYIDDHELFSSRYDRFSYDQNSQANLDRDYRLLSWDKGYFYKLFRDHGNELDLYSTTKLYGGVVAFDPPALATGWLYSILESLGLDWRYPEGVTTLPAGNHEFRIETADFWGNTTSVSGHLAAGGANNRPAESQSIIHSSDSMRVKMNVEFYDDFCRLEFSFLREPEGRLQIEGRTSPLSSEHIELERIGPRRFLCGWPLNSGQSGAVQLRLMQKTASGESQLSLETISYQAVGKKSSQIVHSDDGRFQIRFHASSLYKTMFVRIKAPAPVPGLDRITDIYQVDPDDVALSGEVTLRYRLADADTGQDVGVYRKSGNPARWQFIGNDRQEEGFISANSTALGSFCLIRDSVPPVLLSLQPADGSRVQDRTPVLAATFKDDLSGMGSEESLQLWLDGKKTIAEYDPEDQALRYPVKQPLTAGRHELECRLVDRSHNPLRQKHFFWVK